MAVNLSGMNLPALNDSALRAEVSENQRYVHLKLEHLQTGVVHPWQTLVRSLPLCHPTKGPWIAGGCVRRFLMNTDFDAADIDYFCHDKQQHHLTCARLESMDASMVQETEHHRTYKCDHHRIQIIRTRFHDSLEEHLDQFDFRICQTGWDGESFVVSLDAFKDLLSKELNTTGVFHNPVGSLVRILKYYKQGFKPTPACITALLEAGKDCFSDHGTYTETL